MPDRCCIPDCRAISGRQHGKISVFRIPKDESVRAKWLKAIGRKNFNPGPRDVLCEKHFQPDCIIKKEDSDSTKGWLEGNVSGSSSSSSHRARPILASGSLPTIFNKIEMVGKIPIEIFNQRLRKNRKERETHQGQKKKNTLMMMELQKKKKKRGRKKKNKDSMSLQQRLLTSASSTSKTEASNLQGSSSLSIKEIEEEEEEEEKLQRQQENVALKSQPLSPTKLKVTRQSTGSLKKNREKDRDDKLALSASSSSLMQTQEVCLKWNSHHANMQTVFPLLLNKEQYCDVTLMAEGKSLKCHKLILSSCSSYFDEILEKVLPHQHPVIFMKDVPFDLLKSLCDYMYVGEVNISQNDLEQLLAVAESLKIKGLAQNNTTNDSVNKKNKMGTPSKRRQKNVDDDEDEDPEYKVEGGGKNSYSRNIRKRNSNWIESKDKKKNNVVDDVVTDPLDLLEPTYEEPNPPSGSSFSTAAVRKSDQQQQKKTPVKRIRKRKYVDDDHESSPPVFSTRKGTRSRPNVKVPKYFNASFDNSLNLSKSNEDGDEGAISTNNGVDKNSPSRKRSTTYSRKEQGMHREFDGGVEETPLFGGGGGGAVVDSFPEFEIKTEPVDIEDDEQVEFGEETYEEVDEGSNVYLPTLQEEESEQQQQQREINDDENIPELERNGDDNFPTESFFNNVSFEERGGGERESFVVIPPPELERESEKQQIEENEFRSSEEIVPSSSADINDAPELEKNETTSSLPSIDKVTFENQKEDQNLFENNSSKKNNNSPPSVSSNFFEIEKVTSVSENEENTTIINNDEEEGDGGGENVSET